MTISKDACKLPTVSVVMPVRNEENFIDKSLGAILAQDYPHRLLEVIVVDGMSTDATRRHVTDLAAAHPSIPVTILDNKEKIAPTAMNIGINGAHGKIIVRVDGHAIIEAGYIRKCIEVLLSENADCVGGVVDSVGAGYMGEAIALAMGSRWGVGGSGFRTKKSGTYFKTDTVPFGAFRRAVFEKVGLFNEKMVRHQDYEFNYRIRKAGMTILLLPSARATYFVRSSLISMLKQYWQYGIYKGRFLKTYPESLKFRHLVPPLFCLCLVISAVFAAEDALARNFFLVTAASYAFFLLLAEITFLLQGRWKYLPIIPLILSSLHFSWGIGVLFGLFFKPMAPSSQRI